MNKKDQKEKKGEEAEKGSSPLQIDPKCIQDALRAFLPPIKSDDPRLDFYTMYKREADEHDTDYVKKYDEDLNTTLIFAGLFSAVSSAFVIDVHSKLQPDPNEQSAALLRAILLTLNRSAIPNETPTIPPAQDSPPSEIVTVTGLMYASLLISLLAAFVAMLGKQWLNRYLRNAGGSMIERCGDRQRKCDGLKKWPFCLFIESLPVMLQVALLLLACGLCKHMATINASVAGVLVTLTVLGVLFYLGIVVAGTYSYECPFQTPASIALHSIWKKTGPRITATLRSIVATGTSTLHHLWEAVQCQILHVVLLLPPITILHHSQASSLPITQPTPQQPAPWLGSLHSLWEDIQCGILRAALRLPQIQPLSIHITVPTSQWLTPTTLVTLHSTNVNDIRCISWILWNITDPEALDSAVRLAGTVCWFEDGLNVEPPYDQIISILRGCFSSAGKIYPGSRDRAYYSAQAMLWIHIRSMYASEAANRFPLPAIDFDTASLDPDLSSLLKICAHQYTPHMVIQMYGINPEATATHLQWTSNALLHLSWAKQNVPDTFDLLFQTFRVRCSITIPLNAVLDRLLTSCIFLGWPVGEELLKIQNKIGHFDQILSQFSQAMAHAIHISHPGCIHLKYLLNHLQNSGHQTKQLTEMAYGWCSVVCENQSTLTDGKEILFLSLEIGFRYLNPKDLWIDAKLTHTEHHQGLADIIFGSKDQEAIADLLHAWTSESSSHGPHTSLSICAKYLIGLHLYPLSPRLQLLIIHAVGVIGYQPFEQAGVEGFVGLLNDLQICVEDLHNPWQWATLLLSVVQSSQGIQHLSHIYWELLVKLSISHGHLLRESTYNPDTTTSLEEAKEWDKLECWMGVVWTIWPPECGKTTEEDLEHTTLLLFHHQPSAAQKLVRWMEQPWMRTPKLLQQICKQVDAEAVQEVLLSTLTTNGETLEHVNLQPPTPRLCFGDDTF